MTNKVYSKIDESTTTDSDLIIERPVSKPKNFNKPTYAESPHYIVKEIDFNKSQNYVNKINMKEDDCTLINNNVTYHIFEPNFRESLNEFEKILANSDQLSGKNLKNLTNLQITLLSSISKLVTYLKYLYLMTKKSCKMLI